MNTTTFEWRLREALAWIVRLPLIGECELAALLGVDFLDAQKLRFELDRRGYVDWVTAGVARVDQLRRAAFLRPESLVQLAHGCGFPEDEIVRRAPVRRTDLLRRVPRIETVSGVYQLLADLAVEHRERGEAVLADACSLPLGRVQDRWWPQDVDAYGVVRRGSRSARFFVAWDRAGAPDLYRRARVRPWADVANATDAVILLVCAGARQRDVWAREVARLSERGRALPEMRLTTAGEVLAEGARSAIWSLPGSPEQMDFERAVIWRDEAVQPLLLLPAAMALLPVVTTVPRLRAWAAQGAPRIGEARVRERVAALALATNAEEQRCLEWLARHPRLSASQLASLLGASVTLVTRRLEWLTCCGAVQCTTDACGNDQWVATLLALQLLAAAEGVPWRRYERYGAVDAPGSGSATIRHRSLPHELGINRAFTQIAADARTAGGRLRVWRNEAESTHHFTDDGGPAWIRPDGSGVLVLGEADHPFLLEYDRGTLDGGDFRKKFAAYRRYYAAEAWRDEFSSEPALLFVCSEDRAERRVRRALSASKLAYLPALLTTEWRTRAPGGLMGRVWVRAGDGQDRVSLSAILASGGRA